MLFFTASSYRVLKATTLQEKQSYNELSFTWCGMVQWRELKNAVIAARRVAMTAGFGCPSLWKYTPLTSQGKKGCLG